MEQLPLLRAVDLPAQIADVHVDDVALRVEVEPPHVLDQHRPCEDAAGVSHEVFEQRPLPCGVLDPPPGSLDLARGGVEREIGQAQYRRAPPPAAPEKPPPPGHELLGGE